MHFFLVLVFCFCLYCLLIPISLLGIGKQCFFRYKFHAIISINKSMFWLWLSLCSFTTTVNLTAVVCYCSCSLFNCLITTRDLNLPQHIIQNLITSTALSHSPHPQSEMVRHYYTFIVRTEHRHQRRLITLTSWEMIIDIIVKSWLRMSSSTVNYHGPICWFNPPPPIPFLRQG